MSQINRHSQKEIEICHYPKHHGKLWVDVIEEDYEYVMWLVGADGPPLREDQYDFIMELLEEHDESH